MSKSDYTEYILRFSFGKDSFKTLDVIFSRGLPLDRITTTDVWATETIPAWLPPMDEFKARAEDWIWTKYRMEVEHLCATNKDGSKRTYEQMFYHIPNRRSQTVQVERERETGSTRLRPGSIRGFPDLWNKWCQSDLKRNAKVPSAGINQRIPRNYRCQLVSETQDCANALKDSRLRSPVGARSSKSIMSEPLSQ